MNDGYDINVECPECGADFSVSGIAAGSIERCPVCGAEVSIPSGADRASPARAEEVVELEAAEEGEQEETAPETPSGDAGRQGGLVFANRLPEGSDAPCFVCLAGEEKVKAVEIGQSIQSITGNNRHDVLALINRGMGIIAQTTRPNARLVIEAMRSKGLHAFAVNALAVPDLAPLRVVHQVSFTTDGFVVHPEFRGTEQTVRWTEVTAAGCGIYESIEEKYVSSMREPLNISGRMGGRGRYVPSHVDRRRKEEIELFVLAYASRDSRRSVQRFSFNAKKVNYNCLGKSKSASNVETFRYLCAVILRHSTGAFIPESTINYVSGNRMRLPVFTSRQHVDWHHRWMLCCAAALSGPAE